MTLRDALLADTEWKGVRRTGWSKGIRIGYWGSGCDWQFWDGDGEGRRLTEIGGVLRPFDILATDWEVMP